MTVQRLSSLLFLAGAIAPLVVSMMFGVPELVVWAILLVLAVASFRICFAASRFFPERWWWWWVPLNIIPAMWGLMASQVFGSDPKPYLLPGFILLGSLVGCLAGRSPKNSEAKVPEL